MNENFKFIQKYKESYKIKKSKTKSNAVFLQKSKIWRAKCAVVDGEFMKAFKAFSSKRLANPFLELQAEMLTKHPQALAAAFPSDPLPSPPNISEALVLRAVRSFPGGSAQDPSSAGPSHIGVGGWGLEVLRHPQ